MKIKYFSIPYNLFFVLDSYNTFEGRTMVIMLENNGKNSQTIALLCFTFCVNIILQFIVQFFFLCLCEWYIHEWEIEFSFRQTFCDFLIYKFTRIEFGQACKFILAGMSFSEVNSNYDLISAISHIFLIRKIWENYLPIGK